MLWFDGSEILGSFIKSWLVACVVMGDALYTAYFAPTLFHCWYEDFFIPKWAPTVNWPHKPSTIAASANYYILCIVNNSLLIFHLLPKPPAQPTLSAAYLSRLPLNCVDPPSHSILAYLFLYIYWFLCTVKAINNKVIKPSTHLVLL